MRAARETAGPTAAGERPRLAVHWSSATAEWTTPPAVLTRVVQCLGAIDLDPCADAAHTVPATRHFTVNLDGLHQPWSGRVYMNPPYGRPIRRWVTKLLEEVAAGRVTAAIALVPARTDTAWFRQLDGWPVAFWHGRLRFGAAPNAAPFPSALVAIRVPVARLVEVFAPVATVYRPGPDASRDPSPEAKPGASAGRAGPLRGPSRRAIRTGRPAPDGCGPRGLP